jgi:transposase-like protein
MDQFSADHFRDDDAARALIEGIRWPTGPVCAHCTEAVRRYETKRAGRYRCGNPYCRKDYTVTTGTVMESSHIPLHKWMQGFYLMSSSKKGMSSHQLHRSLGITYKAAWFMSHRIREAMRAGGLAQPPIGGAGKIVEADETYFGNVAKAKLRTTKSSGGPFLKRSVKGGTANKRAILSLVERGGSVRSFHVPVADKETVSAIVARNIAHESRLHTDESRLYTELGGNFAKHRTVKHSAGEYVRREMEFNADMSEIYITSVHSNTVENVFSIFKRGMKGVYQHCAEKHLHRYLAEFDFRYNHRVGLGVGDVERTKHAVKGAEGKRITYR